MAAREGRRGRPERGPPLLIFIVCVCAVRLLPLLPAVCSWRSKPGTSLQPRAARRAETPHHPVAHEQVAASLVDARTQAFSIAYQTINDALVIDSSAALTNTNAQRDRVALLRASSMVNRATRTGRAVLVCVWRL